MGNVSKSSLAGPWFEDFTILYNLFELYIFGIRFFCLFHMCN